MDPWEREYHVARVLAGLVRCPVRGVAYAAVPPGREARFRACEVYREALGEARLEGAMTEAEAVGVLIDRRAWSAEQEAKLAELPRAIEDAKVGLYENWSRSDARQAIRRALAKLRAEQAALEAAKHALDHLTAEGVATVSRARFLAGASLRRPDGTPHWPDPAAAWSRPDLVVAEAMERIAEARLPEGDLRDLARNDPWRSIYNAGKRSGRGVMDLPAADLTDEQKVLMLWSSAYDSIRNHPEAPPERVLEDDDMLDGWMIVQRRKQESEAVKDRADAIKSDKIRSADEVFFVADTVEDAREIDRMNDAVSRHIKQQRFAQVKEKGEVKQMEFADMMNRFRMEAAQAESNRIRAK